MLTNKLCDNRIKQEQRKNYLQYLIQLRVTEFEKAYVFTWPNLINLKELLQDKAKSAPRSWNEFELQDGIDRFINCFIAQHDIPERVG